MPVAIEAASSETFGAVASYVTTSLPAGAADRIPVVAILTRSGTAARTITSCKVGTTELTSLGEFSINIASGLNRVAFFHGTKGLSGQVSVVMDGAVARGAAHLIPVSGADALAASASATAASTATLSGAINVPANGVLLVGGYTNSNNVTPTWSGVDALATSSNGTNSQNSAGRTFASAQSGYSFSATYPVAQSMLYAVALSTTPSAGRSAAGAATFAPMSGAAAGQLALRATATRSFAPLTTVSAAKLPVRAQGGGSLAPLAGGSSARLAVRAAGAATFSALQGAAQSAAPGRAQAAATLAPLVGFASGVSPRRAQAIGSLAPLTGSSFAGAGAASGAQGAATFAPLVGQAVGRLPIRAAGAHLLAALVSTAVARLAIRATAAATFAPLVALARGVRPSAPPAGRMISVPADPRSIAVSSDPRTVRA